jgi:hypothetical protein
MDNYLRWKIGFLTSFAFENEVNNFTTKQSLVFNLWILHWSALPLSIYMEYLFLIIGWFHVVILSHKETCISNMSIIGIRYNITKEN